MWEFATKFFPFFSFCLSPLHPSLPPPTPTSGNHHSVPCVYKLNFLCVCFVFKIPYKITGLPRCTSGKEPNCRWGRHGFESLGQEDPLEKEMATHSSVLAWRILWTEEPGGLQSIG